MPSITEALKGQVIKHVERTDDGLIIACDVEHDGGYEITLNVIDGEIQMVGLPRVIINLIGIESESEEARL